MAFLDGHGSRLSIPMLKWCRDRGLLLYAGVPNCTHLWQPHDTTNFGKFKALLRRKKLERNNTLRATKGNRLGVLKKEDIMPLVRECFDESFTTALNVSGVEKTGLAPFNEALLYHPDVAPTRRSADSADGDGGAGGGDDDDPDGEDDDGDGAPPRGALRMGLQDPPPLSYIARARSGDGAAEARITAAILAGMREMLVGETEKDEAVLRVDSKVAEVEAAGGKITTGAFFKEQGLTSKKGIEMLEAAADRALDKAKGISARAAAKAATAEAKSATAVTAANEEEALLMRAKPGIVRASLSRTGLNVIRVFV